MAQREQLKQIIESYILEREQLVCLFVLLDCRHEAQKIDLEFMEWLGENGVPFSIIFTKTDKISKGRLKQNLQAYQAKMLETWEELPPMFVSSSEKKEGRDEILDYIEEINNSLTEDQPEELDEELDEDFGERIDFDTDNSIN